MSQPGFGPEAIIEGSGGVAPVAGERLGIVNDAVELTLWTLAQHNGVVISAQTGEAGAPAGPTGGSPAATMVMNARREVDAAGADNSATVLQRLDDAA